jgi:hypothetical protein
MVGEAVHRHAFKAALSKVAAARRRLRRNRQKRSRTRSADRLIRVVVD